MMDRAIEIFSRNGYIREPKKKMTSALTSTSKALLIGLNYRSDPANRLSGCINDVRAMAKFLTSVKPGIAVRVVDDEWLPAQCTKAGLLQELTGFVDSINKDPLCTFAWLHYSGHGSCTRDRSADETDGKDEALVPVDFLRAGLILDDQVTAILSRLSNPACKVVCVMDSCHSGTVCDLKYKWVSPTVATLDNARALPVKSRIILLSGCMDAETSADAFGVLEGGPKEPGGALTGCLLNTLTQDKVTDAFQVQQAVLKRLKASGFTQRPVLTSSFNLQKDLQLL